jgi:1-acyl-sn-glycerol-3-phosphate acyltransferase
LSLWAFIRHFFGLTVAVIGAATDAALRGLAGKTSHAERAAWLHRWCAFLLRRLSVNLHQIGKLPASGLIVCNHLSYLDIIVFSALAPCAFVSKREVRKWPVFGLFAAIAGTIFVDRSLPALARASIEEMQATLRAGSRVVLFPEGTSTGGDRVLPFKPALFESAVETRQAITAAYLRYEVAEGEAAQIACYWGDMTFLPHLLRLMFQRRVVAHIRFADTGHIYPDRKRAAVESQEQVVRLGQSAV